MAGRRNKGSPRDKPVVVKAPESKVEKPKPKKKGWFKKKSE